MRQRIHRIGRFIFKGGDERQYINALDVEELQRACMEKRVALSLMAGHVSIIRECEGHRIKFTQKQIRSMVFHTELVD